MFVSIACNAGGGRTVPSELTATQSVVGTCVGVSTACVVTEFICGSSCGNDPLFNGGDRMGDVCSSIVPSTGAG